MPDQQPTTAASLAQEAADWVKITTSPDAAMSTCAEAVKVMIEGLPRDLGQADVYLGAVMLTARLWRRRNSPAGIEAFTESGASYVSRYDSDIARLLKIDSFQKPVAI